MTAVWMFVVFFVLLIIGAPIAMSLGIGVMAAIVLSPDLSISFEVIPQRIYGGLESTSLMAIPFFVLAGNIMTKGGISRRLVGFANSIVGNLRGGMGVALTLSCAFFAALSGSAPATVIAIGVMLYPDMVRLGYPKGRTAGMLTVAGGLGPIIPPSIIMVVYATIVGASVADMFKSGLIIGLLLLAVLIGMAIILAYKEKWPISEQPFRLKNVGVSFVKAIPALLLPTIILGGIYSGILTPTESAAVAVVWSLIASICIYRELKLSDLTQIIIQSAKGSSMVLFITATSTVFSWLFAYSGVSSQLIGSIQQMKLSPVMFCLVVAVILLVFGTFLEGIATAVLLVPILWPIAQSLGVDIIHFGMIVSISNVVGTMTPPVAVNIFSAASVTHLKMGQIVKGEIPFFVAYLAVFLVVVLVPSISTFVL